MYCIISTVQYCHFESNMIRYGTVPYGTVRYVAAKKNNYTTINQFLNLTISNY